MQLHLENAFNHFPMVWTIGALKVHTWGFYHAHAYVAYWQKQVCKHSDPHKVCGYSQWRHRGQKNKKSTWALSERMFVSPLQGNCCVLTLVGNRKKKKSTIRNTSFKLIFINKGVIILTVLCSAWTCGRWYSGDSHCDVNGAENDSTSTLIMSCRTW